MGSRGGAGCTQQDSSVGLEVAGFGCQGNNNLESNVRTTGTLAHWRMQACEQVHRTAAMAAMVMD